jgi:CRP/FNR family transcriptional regulator, cyclic AMP receptor protein
MVGSMPVAAERLQAVSLFSTLSADELAALGGKFEERQVRAGTRLTTEGASGYSFFVIENGTVEVERDGTIVNTLGPGDFFGETAILSGERRNATITAASEVDLLVLFGTEFRILERDWPAVASTISAKMAERTTLAPQAD